MRRKGQVGEQSDADLARLATAGDLAAFEELYRRHVEAAWRMALAVTTNPHDAADAVSDAFTRVFQALPDRPEAADHFLPYLLAAVRNAAIDTLRRGGRQRATDPSDQPDADTGGMGPSDLLLADVEASLVARAFRSLPERWRSVLWLTEVENIPAREVAGLLGLSPNGVAQLAVRARAGLRQRYLQAHLRQTAVHLHCQDTVSKLGAYAAGALSPRDLSKVDQHLAGCAECRSRLAELQDMAPSLRRAVLPLPLALGALSAAKWHLAADGAAAGATTASAATAGGAATVSAGFAAASVSGPLVATLASATLFVGGLVGAGVVDHRQPAPTPPAVAAAAPTAQAASFTAAAAPAPAATSSTTDPVQELLDQAAAAGADVRPVTDAVEDLAAEVTSLRTPTAEELEAAMNGDVKVDLGAAAAEMDLRKGSEACLSFQVMGVRINCSGMSAAVEPPTEATE